MKATHAPEALSLAQYGRQTIHRLSCTLLLAAIAACSGDSNVDRGDLTPAMVAEQEEWATSPKSAASGGHSFLDYYEPIAEIAPVQTDAHLVASIGQVHFDSLTGHIYLADPSEGNIKVFSMDGNLAQVIGRKGRGPGELMGPWFLGVAEDRRVHVVDTGQYQVSVFDPEGRHLKNIPFQESGGVRGFGLLSDDSYLVLVGGPQDVLIHVDSTGTPVSSHLPIASILPDAEPDDPIWGYARNFFLDIRNDTAFVISSVVNRLWTLDIQSGAVSRTHLDFATYRPPTVPRFEGVEQSAQNAMAEITRNHLAGHIRVMDNAVLVPFVQGNLLDGDPMTLLLGSSTGEWFAIEDSPVILETSGRHLVTVTDAATDQMTLTVYRSRTAR